MEGLSSDLLQGGHVDNPRHLLDNPRRRADENVYQGGDEVKISNRARDLGKMRRAMRGPGWKTPHSWRANLPTWVPHAQLRWAVKLQKYSFFRGEAQN